MPPSAPRSQGRTLGGDRRTVPPGTATGAPAGDAVRLSFLMSNLIR
jgi:hypothetical protein